MNGPQLPPPIVLVAGRPTEDLDVLLSEAARPAAEDAVRLLYAFGAGGLSEDLRWARKRA